VSKGKKTIVIDMRTEKPTDAELLALLLGPTGALRAPTLRSGTKLLVGFAPDAYAKVLR
jgi:arsenate reductase-like glutaredoxin family protein